MVIPVPFAKDRINQIVAFVVIGLVHGVVLVLDFLEIFLVAVLLDVRGIFLAVVLFGFLVLSFMNERD